jgi:hypothetical protein
MRVLRAVDPPGRSWPLPGKGWQAGVWRVPYVYAASPDGSEPPSWLEGSNCQRYAYGVLSLFGLRCPPLRSSELWDDQGASAVVTDPRPLDLVLFNGSADPYGAHVGLWMAPDEILHLCREVGVPVVWSTAEFARRPRYATTVGFKRVKGDG